MAAETQLVLSTVVQGTEAATKAFNDIKTSVNGVADSVKTSGEKLTSLGSSISGIGTQMTLGLTLPIVELGEKVIKTSVDFQASMELIRTQAGSTQGEVDSLTKSVLALAESGKTGQGPQALADGLYHLESLGLRGKQAMDALTISAQAADLGIADMEGVTSALGAAMVTGIKGTENMSEAMGILDATIGQGNMRMDGLVAALGTGILPTAKAFGLSLKDVGAALATLTDNGMGADEAATRLRMTISLMGAPSKKAADALKTIGISSTELADDMRKGGIISAIDDLNAHLKDSGETATEQAQTIANAFGGGRSSAAILTLSSQVDRLKTKFDAIGTSADGFNDKVAATQTTNLFKINAALSQMQATFIDLGGTVMPLFSVALQQISDKVKGLVDWWNTLSDTHKKWLVIAAGILAVLGPILSLIGSLITVVGVLVTAFGYLGVALTALGTALGVSSVVIGSTIAVIVALGAALYEVYNNWSVIQPKLIEFWNTLKKDVSDIVESMGSFILTEFDNVTKGIQDAINYLANAAQQAKDYVSSVLSQTASIGKSFTIQGVYGALSGARATGGQVNGSASYLVGENGPEIFTPSSSGNIIPNNKISGNNGVTINITGTFGQGVADELSNMIVNKLKMASYI